MLNTHGHISKSYTCHVHCVFMFFISTINITINIITNNYMLTIAISILHSNQKFKLARVLLLSTSGFSEDSENRRASCINRYSPDAMVSITSLLSPVSGFTNLSNMSLSVFWPSSDATSPSKQYKQCQCSAAQQYHICWQHK